jgi:cytochrome c
MSSCDALLLASLLCLGSASVGAATSWHGLGRKATSEQLASWDIDVRPDGTGLPPGSGTVADGQVIYDEKCASCHGTFGESNDYIALAGGIGTLASANPQRTVGSKLNYATTLWDYINRAMPFNNSKTLSANEVYAVTAYVLNLNEIVPADAVLDQTSLPKIVMPNRDGFTLDHGMGTSKGKGDVANSACMQKCITTEIKVTSELPAGFTAQMYGDIQIHFRHFDRPPLAPAVAGNAPQGLTLAQSNGCFACHDVDKMRVGPAFSAIASRYGQTANDAQSLSSKVHAGGKGVWGSVPMPPQAQISDADLTTVVDWILKGAPRQ